MNPSLISKWTLLAWVLPLVTLEAFFSGSEIALLSADKLYLLEQSKAGSSKSTLALKIAGHPERILSTTLLITNLCIVGISAIISLYFLENFHKNQNILAIAVTSPIIVFLGELIPKTIFQRNANTLAPWVAYPLHFTYWLFYPITRGLTYYTARLSHLVGPIEELLAGRRKTTRDEIRSLLTYKKNETEIKTTEKEMIKRIFDFRYSEARHALIPLVRVEAIEESSDLHFALECFERHRHSRMPVYLERIDNIIGILEIADLFSVSDLKQPIRSYITRAQYVAETQPLQDLMMEMRRKDHEMAVVVDEHGGAVGILTFEDIVEEIAGEINDEFDYESMSYRTLSEYSWIIQATMEIQKINEAIKIEIPDGNYETLSGFLLQQFGRIPEAKDELFFDTPTGAYKFTIQRATERHIETVVIEKQKNYKEG